MRFYRHAARLQTVSQPIKEAIAAELPRGSDLVRCIPNPLPEATFDEPSATGTHGDLQLLYVGRVHPEKGLDLLIQALLTLGGGWRLTVVGPAEVSDGGGGEKYFDELRTLAQPIADRVEWVGAVYDRTALAGHYRSASLFVYPSMAERGETFGLAPLEAMSHGCPALVSDLPCFGEYLVDGRNGFAFARAGGAAALQSKLRGLLDHRELVEAARAPALDKAKEFSVSEIAEMYLRDFAHLLEHGRA